MGENAPSACVRDVSVVVFAIIFEMRESSILRIKEEDVPVLTTRKYEVLL